MPRPGVTREQQLEHVRGQLVALAFDIRQARANDDLTEVMRLEYRRDELLDWMLRLGT